MTKAGDAAARAARRNGMPTARRTGKDADHGKAREKIARPAGHFTRDHGEPTAAAPQSERQKHDQAHAPVAPGAVGYRIT
jgi:hypothetical protein